jgi:tRNA modification GTPase
VILNLIDTAGVRRTEDIVEKIGVEKAKMTIEKSDLVILVFDFSEPLNEVDEELLKMTADKTRIIVVNKRDLEQKLDLEAFEDYLLLSTFDEGDIEKLKAKIKEIYKLSDLSDLDYTYIGNARQIAKLKQALKALEDADESISMGQPVDISNIDLHHAFDYLGEILGEKHVSIVDELFANFCLGK